MNQSKMDEVLNRVAEHMSLEFMRDNLEKIRHCVATGAPIIIKDGELVDTTNDGPWAEGWEERCRPGTITARDPEKK